MIEIRRPILTECNKIKDFFHQLLLDNFPMFSEAAIAAYEQSWAIDRLGLRIANEKELLLIAWENQTPIGVISGTPPEGGVGTIIWLIVHRNARGKNLGKILLEKARQHYLSLGCHKMKLTAPSVAAKEFYLKQGMELEGFHKAHWYKIDFWALGETLA